MNFLICFLFILYFNNSSTVKLEESSKVDAVKIEESSKVDAVKIEENSKMDAKDLFRKIFADFKMPEEIPDDLRKIVKLPRSVHPIILGNIEYLPADTRDKVFAFYNTCVRCKIIQGMVNEYEEKIVTEIIFSWKLSRDVTNLDELLNEKMSHCFQTVVCQGTEDIEKIEEPSAEPTELQPKSCRQMSAKISPSHLADQSLPGKACARVLMTKILLAPFGPDREPRYSGLFKSLLQQIIRAIHLYLNKPDEESETVLNNRLRMIFFTVFRWFEEMYVGSIVAQNNKSNIYQPDNIKLPSLQTIISYVPEQERRSFAIRWSVLLKIINFPVDTSLVILGNIHLLSPVSVNGILDKIEECRKKPCTAQEFTERQVELEKKIMQYKYGLYHIWENRGSLIFKDKKGCEGGCGTSPQNYKKIGDEIQCDYLHQDKSGVAKKKEDLETILNDEKLFNSPELQTIISLLPAQLCICASVQRINIKKLPNPKYKRKFNERLIKEYTAAYKKKTESDDEITSKGTKRLNESEDQNDEGEGSRKKQKKSIEFTRQDSTMTDSTNDGQIVDPPTPPLQKLPVIIEDASKPAEMDMQIGPEGLNLELTL